MKEQLEKRVKELRAEFESGQKALADMEFKQTNLRNTLLRISGAMQVLQEELEKESKSNDTGQLDDRIGGIHKQEERTETG
jgi:hypothetical protein